jgi:hypothetical protein
MRIINEYKSFLYFMVPTFNSKFDYYYFYTISGFTNPTPLKIISSSRFVRKGCRKNCLQSICQFLIGFNTKSFFKSDTN